ncbi:hypothetical protein [Peribacillus asahii]|uniref:hypothetical protein n=1 Tax=Peribacillus asahii TaxID=228899 RepID=UPI000FDA2420|nr:hypothetical protein [Peribacillus asahii]USK84511.1 hypothetical protein LIT35_19275 [Peribacillus asahii]
MEKKLEVLLRDAEYSFDKSTSNWRYTGEGQVPDDELLLGKPHEEETEISTSAQPTKEQVALAVFTLEQVTLRSDTFSYVVASTFYGAPFKECKGRD